MAAEPVLSLHGVGHRFGATRVLAGVDLAVQAGERLAVIGPNGAGKSTLFGAISGGFVPTEGRVLFEGQSVFDMSESQQAWFRCNRIGYIFHQHLPGHTDLAGTIDRHLAILHAVAGRRVERAVAASDALIDFMDQMFEAMESGIDPGLLDCSIEPLPGT